ncbi:PD-(D/E)XK nuclease family protein [Bradyrhizobium sp. CW7]|uniref:hypothetical protein n=1 Tax=Bradyrhizobium sp. CW7 TaxID=2782688 RepID=UPI001FF8A800|nr:hypothetical protein [Bradyrhizobium sp. CW7]MCK1354628.1 PD-(D/E)XK nuclease family protein [Bradyrhizobium sp. CW7]
MAILTLHTSQIETIFDLLGQKENDLTAALGWVLANSPQLLLQLAVMLDLKDGFSERVKIRLQEPSSSEGITDVEIDDPGSCHVIIEAKRGFNTPHVNQLEKYANRLNASRDKPKTRLLVVLAEDDRGNNWLQRQIPDEVGGVPVRSISWQTFSTLASRIRATGHTERHLLNEFVRYLSKVITMQDQRSNLVYVVSLGNDTFGCGETTFIDVVEKYNQYFHPIGGTGGGWPYDPPNYLAFRYRGQLQSVHHVESYDVITDFQPHFCSESVPTYCPHFLYKLGPAIRPSRRIPTNGKELTLFRSARKWIYIDLLLTADSVADAADLTKRRDQASAAN